MTDPTILRTELLSAVEKNKVDRVRTVLNSGIDPNSVCDEKGRWPIHIACLNASPAIVRFAISQSNVIKSNIMERNPGFQVKLLLEHGAQKDQPDTALERTPLHYAATTSKETVQVLLNHRVDIQSRNKFGATALHYAAGASKKIFF